MGGGGARRSDEWESRMKEGGVKIDETGCGDERER